MWYILGLLLGSTRTLCAATPLDIPNAPGALFYCMVMAVSACGFWVMRSYHRGSVPLIFYVIHSIIVLWSGLMYVHFIFDTPVVPYVYYMDWIISTPLIVLALALTGLIQTADKPWGYVLALMALQATIIVTGLFAYILGPTTPAGLTYFALGNVAMLGVFYLIWGPFMRAAHASSASLYSKYYWLGIYVIVLWIAYPIIWILGSDGYGIFSEAITRMLFIVLPIICKAGFGFLDLYLLNRLSEELNKQLAFIWIALSNS